MLPCPSWLLKVNFTAQQPGQFADDRQPQTGALMLTGQHVVFLSGYLRLAEFLKDRLLVFLGDANARILHFQNHEASRRFWHEE